MSFIFTYSRDALSVFIGGVPRTINNGHPKWDEIMEIVRGQTPSTPEELQALLDYKDEVVSAIKNAAGNQFGRVTVGFESILLDGKPIHSVLTQRMLEMIKQGFDVSPMARFMDKLYSNPSRTAVEELYLWLENSNLPITKTGNFLAYKKVADDYSSYHRNADGSKCWNKIGSVVEMPRNEVDDNRNHTCSKGLHFCSYDYLPSYYGNEGRVVVVEINPADVVSIPSDYNNAKGRASRYLIRDEVDESEASFAFPEAVVEQSEYDLEYDENYELYFNEDGEVEDDDFDLDDWAYGHVYDTETGAGFRQNLYHKFNSDLRLIATFNERYEFEKAVRP